jgi:hypothetical protein
VAATGVAAARVAREVAKDEPVTKKIDEPYAPSKSMAPIITLGYREVAADLLFVRLAGYFGGTSSTAEGIGSLVDAIVALDPRYHRIYSYGSGAITLARYGVDQAAYEHAIAVLDIGMTEFNEDAKFPELAADIYLHDLQTKDPVKRREWDEKAASLFEAASRKPGADAGNIVEAAAALQTKFGHRERAIAGLREMLLITTDDHARKRLIDKLAELSHEDANEIAAELQEARDRFTRAWFSERPALPATMFILLGPKLAPSFDPVDLATGGHDLVGSQPIERLEPLE